MPQRRKLIESFAAFMAATTFAAPAFFRPARAQALKPGGTGVGERHESPLPPVGSSLDLPAIKLLDGHDWKPSKIAGKALVVYWWASDCPFCAAQSPHIEALWRAQQANGLEVLALSIDKKQAVAATYMKTRNYSFPAGMLTPEAARSLPRPPGLPVTVVLKVSSDGRTGKVVFAEGGEMFPEDVEGLKKYI